MNKIRLTMGYIMNKKKVIAWGMLIFWMSVIFFMSNQPGEVSTSQSDLVLKLFSLIGINLNQYFGELATLVIRKGAHFTEYLILFILAYRVIRFYVDRENIKWYAIAVVFLYACSDEMHQYFIPGRGPAFKDVMVDTSGGLLGVIISSLYEKRVKN